MGRANTSHVQVCISIPRLTYPFGMLSRLKNSDALSSPSASKLPISTLTLQPSAKKSFDPDRCYDWFKTYTDRGLTTNVTVLLKYDIEGLDEDFDTDQIGPNGIAKLCEDIGVSLEAVDMLVLAYHLEADTMQKLKAAMPGLVAKLRDPQQFKEFYRYVFMFAKDSEQKCMPLETACAMLQTVLKGRPHEKRFVEFLEAKEPVKVINKDQWYNFLDFSDSITEDLANYDGASSAWPVLLDEYVEWRNEESS
ncbi:Cullin binding-domain-containing protein [Gamsiella multidivaricata]|uniref:Cullin binding-domain-containing protein n=1 Tax=Gamsiella multidivaricata TaxID=101098 RepID=UPI002220FE92|nr:Cullin binding-domain-containing protein [Gamsiella multidivaricata]KAI7816227.1 Cullin binding-domain-containing protein [Gamsiella multidivaricata]